MHHQSRSNGGEKLGQRSNPAPATNIPNEAALIGEPAVVHGRDTQERVRRSRMPLPPGPRPACAAAMIKTTRVSYRLRARSCSKL
jgi:hypothetical protein